MNVRTIAKRVAGTLLIAWGLFSIFTPLLTIILIPSDTKVLPPWWKALHITLLLCFMLAGWNIMKMEERIRAKGKRDQNV